MYGQRRLARFLSRPSPTSTIVLVACLAGAMAASPIYAATFEVDRTDDDASASACADDTPDDCSLRGATLAANALSEDSTIEVPAGTYVLSQPSTCTHKVRGSLNSFTSSQVPLCVAKNVTIQGAGAATTIIEGNQQVDRVLFISADATVQISGVTIRRGRLRSRTFGNDGGGGINNHGTLTLTDSVITENTADFGGGGGIHNAGTLTVLRSTVSANIRIGNAGEGGGIENGPSATLTVADSTITNNTAETNGGGIALHHSTVTITNSTLSGNVAASAGGGIFAYGAPGARSTLTVTNSTISGNYGGSQAGGIYNHVSCDTHLRNVTITNNTTGNTGGGLVNGDTLTLRNTIIAGNRADGFGNGPDCWAFAGHGTGLTSQGYNLIQNTRNCDVGGDTTGNIIGQDPELGLLVDNGGPTKTHALSDGSPAVDAGNPAAPGSMGTACAVSDQRGFLRPLGASCDIGAFERSGAFSLVKVLPDTGGNTGSVSALVSGNGFVDGTTLKLTRAGEPDIMGNPAKVDAGGSAIAVTFDLVGRSIGSWDVVAMNPDGTSEALAGGFEIEAGRAHQLWVDVIGRFFRPGRPSRLTVLYGNRGNVDAVGVPLSFSVPVGYAPGRFFAITPPPPQPGQVREDWSQVPVDVLMDGESGFTNIPLLLPVVPAGFTGILQIGLTLPPGAEDSLLLTAIGDPIFDPGLDPEVVSDAVAGAQAYLENGGVTIPPALIPELEQYVTDQLQQVWGSGRAAFVASLGTRSQVYSVSQLHLDLALFGAARAADEPQASMKPGATSAWLSAMSRSLVSVLAQLGPAEAQAQQQNCPVYKPGDVLTEGCTGGGGPEEPFLPPELPPPPGCNLKDPSTFKNCTPTRDHCDSLPGYKVITNASGEPFCVPEKPSNICSKLAANPVGANQGCTIFPLKPKASIDPNDKVGSVGVTDAQFLRGSTPLSYAVFFENLETATAAAQEVVITDQLDIQTMDLATFSLGPISFGGDITLVPAPGVQQYTGGVDLRPDQNVIVAIRASLDEDTGLLTWSFTSIDPDTGQLTDDPDAGFLPPNVNPPEGEGSVVFTVRPKAGFAAGTTICNRASIVFDTNPAIETPAWCNTLSLCGDGSVAPGEDCDDGAANGTSGSCCSSECGFRSSGETCDDGSACTPTDGCDGAGVCVGNAVVCAASDQCHIAGTCDPSTGVCSDPIAADGTTCNDARFCTVNEVCAAGTCSGGPRDCSAAGDQCNSGVCDEGAAQCRSQAKPNGTACEDGDRCTAPDACNGQGDCTSGGLVLVTEPGNVQGALQCAVSKLLW